MGRAKQITRPDGRIVTFTYRGVRQTEQTLDIATQSGGTMAPVTEKTYFDSQGRVVKVDNPEVTTTFRYDPNGNLIESKRSGAEGTQIRTFTRDGRGFLTAESLPEIGPDGGGNGSTAYTRDALGNVRTAFDGLHTIHIDYDDAGRPVRAHEPATGLDWQTWTYATANAGTNYQQGKLIEARRFNYPNPTAPWVVTERYEYEGVAGALSRRLTVLEFPHNPFPDNFGETFEQTWNYDALGRVVSQTYPTCITTPDNGRRYCDDGNDPAVAAFTPTRTYTDALPVGVTGPGISATYQYHPNLTLEKILHGNSTETRFDADPHLLPRPRRISVYRAGNSSPSFDTGLYLYDEAGNIRSIGSDNYVYDRASRLLSGTVNKAGAGKSQAYTYDAFDNLRTVATDGGAAACRNIDAKNRFRSGYGLPVDIFYDPAGNMASVGRHSTGVNVREFTYDALNMQSTYRRFDSAGTKKEDFLYIYGPATTASSSGTPWPPSATSPSETRTPRS